MLPQYYSYIQRNPRTLITRFYGMHRLAEKGRYGIRVYKHYFIVMANVLDANEAIVERYDLKGSTTGRITMNQYAVQLS